MGMIAFEPVGQAELVISAVLADLRSGAHRGVVVGSPTGAGKSTLVVRAAAALAATGEPLMVGAQTSEQVDDLVDRLAAALAEAMPGARVGRLSRAGYETPARIAALTNVDVDSDLVALGRPQVTISTAAKWAHVKDR